jgi:hypothetical protein
MADLTKARVEEIPNCQLPHHEGHSQPAYADARIPGVGWGYVCRAHFEQMGCSLGMGKGQELVLDTES